MALKSKTDYNRKNIEISKINYRKIIDCFFSGEIYIVWLDPKQIYSEHE